MPEIRLSTVEEMLSQCQELFQKHWEELTLNKEVMVLNPDEDRYKGMEEAGMLLLLAATDEERIVGYSVNLIMPHLHYADCVICSNDLLFVDPQYRGTSLGIKLMKATENLAKDSGAKLMLWHAKQDTALEKLMPRMGYKVNDIIFSKGL